MILAPLLLSLAQASAPAAAPPPAAPAAPAFARRRGGKLFISPMGEPFYPERREDDGLANWFAIADRNHDGRLTLDEMQQDAGRFFGLLDLNHDGEIDPDEITHYEQVVAPEIRTGEHFDLDQTDEGDREAGNGARRGGHRRGGGGEDHRFFRSISTDQHQGAGRYGLLDLPEPVTAADSDFNRGVSLNEFRAAAQQRFLALDLDHKGFLTLLGLEAIHPAPPPGEHPPENSRPPNDSDFPPAPGI